jgi:hypothetical protein
MGRRLVSIRRRVPAAEAAGYADAWSGARQAIETTGAHAWAFASTGDASERIEFLEFADGADPRDDSRVVAALDRLWRAYGGTIDEWEEAR